jgi:heparan-sulfate lyase
MNTNYNLIKKLVGKTLFLIVLFSFFVPENGVAQKSKPSAGIEKLLSRIDLNSAGLEKVKQVQNNPEVAAKELLNYFKNRTTVKHPVNQTEKEFITEKDIKWANDALEHIFVGQPAYPSQFCGTDIDWSFRPVPDNEWVWQLNRMYFWNSMGKIYAQTSEEKYAKEWCAQIIDWIRKNPNDENHKYAWRSIEAGIRGYSWTALFWQFINSPHFNSEVLVAYLNSMFDHADYLMTKYSTRSNWGLMEAEGMAFIAINFPEFRNAEQWRNEAFRRLNNEINLQVYPDGHQRELAMGYHIGCINWFLRTYELAKMNNLESAFPISYLETIEKMCEVPMKLCHPDGTNAQFGDSWEGLPGQYSDRFLEWAEKFNREDFLFLATNGREGKKPDSTAFALPQSGLYSMKSDWDKNAISLVLKCGPDGGGHCQPDNGTFELYAGGRNLMPDAGSYIYSGDPENRAWFRQTKVHQTLTLNGENSVYAPKLLLWQPGENLDILVVENQSYENLTHRRSVFFVDKRYFVIVDEAKGTAKGDIDIHFQLAPGGGSAVFNQDSNSAQTNFFEGWNVFVQTQKQKGLELIEEVGQVSFEYTKKEPRPAFCFRLEKKGENENLRFVTIVVPYIGKRPDIDVELIKNNEVSSSKFQLEINENNEKKVIEYSL